ALSAPDAPSDGGAKAAAQRPVERSSLLCPAPSSSDLAETTYTSFTPKSAGGAGKGSAELRPATRESDDDGKGGKDKDDKGKRDKQLPAPGTPGKPVTGEAAGAG
ncbi:hypothetical protein P8605_50390, partial [Streptomyces sp. T-3]|nr:hypothetical protein [Streptomyces sp. T-3]